MKVFGFLRLLTAVGVFLVPQGVYAGDSVPPQYPVEDFAKLPVVRSPKVSPDGTYLAYITSAFNGRKSVVAHPLSGFEQGKSLILPAIKEADVAWFRWANDERLLISYSFYGENMYYKGVNVEQTRLVSAARDGSSALNLVKASRKEKLKRYGRPSGGSATQRQDQVISMLPDDRQHILMEIDDDLDFDVDLRKVNVNSGKYTVVQRGRQDIYDWVVDVDGTPRLGYGKYKDPPKLQIAELADNWDEDVLRDLISTGSIPRFLNPNGKTAIFFVRNQRRRLGLAELSLVSGDLSKWLFNNEKYDIRSYITADFGRDLVGINYVADAPRQIFFDVGFAYAYKTANRVLPGDYNQILNRTADKDIYLVASSGASMPTQYFVFSRSAKRMDFFAVTHPKLEAEDMAEVRKVTYNARDSMEIEAILTLPKGRDAKNLPFILMPHGGPASRDALTFDPMAQMFANRGYAVLQPNFRGSNGYGLGFEEAGEKEWGGLMQDDLTDAANWAIEQGLADKGRMCIVGWSYGGYAATMAAVKTPDLFKCAVSINGVTNLPALWTKDGSFLGGKEWRKSFGDSRSDTRKVSPHHKTEAIKIPILLIASKDDERIDYKQSKGLYSKLKRKKNGSKYVEIKTGGHSLDIDASRITAFTALDQFLKTHLGGQAGLAPSLLK